MCISGSVKRRQPAQTQKSTGSYELLLMMQSYILNTMELTCKPWAHWWATSQCVWCPPPSAWFLCPPVSPIPKSNARWQQFPLGGQRFSSSPRDKRACNNISVPWVVLMNGLCPVTEALLTVHWYSLVQSRQDQGETTRHAQTDGPASHASDMVSSTGVVVTRSGNSQIF